MYKKILGIILFASLLIFFGCSNSEHTSADVDSKPTNQQQLEQETTDQTTPLDNTDPEKMIDYKGAVCVLEHANNSVVFLNPDTGEVIGKHQVRAAPTAAVLSSQGNVYIANSGIGELSIIDVDPTVEINHIPMGTKPMAMVSDLENNTIYAADYHLNSIRIVDTNLNSLISTITLSPKGFSNRDRPPSCCYDQFENAVMEGRKPVSLASSSDGKLYCANIGTYDVSVIDLDTEEEVDQYDGVIGFRDIVLTHDEKSLMLAGVGSDEIVVDSLIVLSTEDGSQIASIPVGQAVAGVSLDPTSDTAAAASRDTGNVVLIDTTTWNETKSTMLEPGISDIAFSKDGSKIFVTYPELGKLTALSSDTLEILYEIDTFIDPRYVTVL